MCAGEQTEVPVAIPWQAVALSIRQAVPGMWNFSFPPTSWVALVARRKGERLHDPPELVLSCKSDETLSKGTAAVLRLSLRTADRLEINNCDHAGEQGCSSIAAHRRRARRTIRSTDGTVIDRYDRFRLRLLCQPRSVPKTLAVVTVGVSLIPVAAGVLQCQRTVAVE